MDSAADENAGSLQSKVVDADGVARIGAGERGKLSDDEGEVFEEALEGNLKNAVLERQFVDGELQDFGVSDDLPQVSGAVEVGMVRDRFQTVGAWSEREVDREMMVEGNGLEDAGVRRETKLSEDDLVDAEKNQSWAAPFEPVGSGEYHGGTASDVPNSESSQNWHSDRGIFQDDDKFVSNGTDNHGNRTPRLEADEDLQKGSDFSGDVQSDVGILDWNGDADTEDKGVILSSDVVKTGEEIGTDVNGACLGQTGSNCVALPVQAEEQQNADIRVPGLSGQPARVNGEAEKAENSSSLSSVPHSLGSSTLASGRGTSHLPRVNGSTTQREASSFEAETGNARRSATQNQALSCEAATGSEDMEECDETHENLQRIRVNFLRLARRLGQTPHNVVVAQVLYRLGLAERLCGSLTKPGAFSFDRASALAEQLEAAGQEPLDFSCTILVLGKTGVGKSATINSIFDAPKFQTDAFCFGTKKVQEMVGVVQGIKLRVIDTPGLLPSFSDQWRNEKILKSIKDFIKKTPPDVIMYLDRLDMQNGELGDIPLLQTITNVFGPSVWFNVIVVLTHAWSTPPEGVNGNPLSFEMYVSQRTRIIQNVIHYAAGDSRLMNPVSCVENHSACRLNRAGQRVLPDGQVWKTQLLLLSFASKVLQEANALLKLQDGPSGTSSGSSRSPPLPFFLSSILQSKPLLKLLNEEYGFNQIMNLYLDSETDSGNETDYDDLPLFRNLSKEELSKLSKDMKRAYYKELDYRERLFCRKQLKQEREHRKQMKRIAGATGKDISCSYTKERGEEETAGLVSGPIRDLALPTSFDSDHPSYRYRALDFYQWFIRPALLESLHWDHDIGYDGLNVEKIFVVKDNIPVSFSGQLMKDKKECTLQMELATSMKPREWMVTSCGMDVQSVGKDIACTIHGETKVKSFKRNSMVAAVSASFLGDTSSVGLKMEDRLVVNRWLRMLINGGLVTGGGDFSYGGQFEATLGDKEYPVGRMLSTLALSMVDWQGEFALSGNFQSQIPLGRTTNLIGHADFGNRGTGQISIRMNTTEHLQIALLALVPLFMNAKSWFFGSSETA